MISILNHDHLQYQSQYLPEYALALFDSSYGVLLFNLSFKFTGSQLQNLYNNWIINTNLTNH